MFYSPFIIRPSPIPLLQLLLIIDSAFEDVQSRIFCSVKLRPPITDYHYRQVSCLGIKEKLKKKTKKTDQPIGSPETVALDLPTA